MTLPRTPSALALLLVSGCAAEEARRDEVPAPARAEGASAARAAADGAPFAGLERCDELIRPGEKHFARLWRLTRGVENAAEAYWSFAGDRLVYQATLADGACDRIFVTDPRGGPPLALTDGRGVTTCAYFLPGDRSVLYASTHAWHLDCPPPPDKSAGYVWQVHPEYDVYVQDLATGGVRALTTEYGYDAEATVSPRGDRVVFTSTRSGDLELWTCRLDGSDLRQITHEPGYDGGAFFSHDGEWLVYRSTMFTPGKEREEIAEYERLLERWQVRPTRMEIMVSRADGSERRRVTNLGKANWAPFFFVGDRRIVFSTNHHDDRRGMPNFDLFAIDVTGENLERITHDPDFDAFPVFSPDGQYLAFASNRGA
ncbi:MAG: PD40 domain-containing protein, partial [Planctomycetes bacterium]|nr:PD40 domain-containing protein [Planctomycetota bacterium]